MPHTLRWDNFGKIKSDPFWHTQFGLCTLLKKTNKQFLNRLYGWQERKAELLITKLCKIWIELCQYAKVTDGPVNKLTQLKTTAAGIMCFTFIADNIVKKLGSYLESMSFKECNHTCLPNYQSTPYYSFSKKKPHRVTGAINRSFSWHQTPICVSFPHFSHHIIVHTLFAWKQGEDGVVAAVLFWHHQQHLRREDDIMLIIHINSSRLYHLENEYSCHPNSLKWLLIGSRILIQGSHRKSAVWTTAATPVFEGPYQIILIYCGPLWKKQQFSKEFEDIDISWRQVKSCMFLLDKDCVITNMSVNTCM